MAAAAPIITAITAQTVQGAIIRFALSLAVSYITQKLFAPELPDGGGLGSSGSQPDPGVKQRIPSDPANKLPVIYGEDKIHGSIIFADITSDNKTMAFIIALCEGPINKIGTDNYGTNSGIYWDDWELSFNLAGSVINATHPDGQTDDWLNGNLKIVKYPDGGRCTDMENFSSKWASGAQNRQLPNLAYVYVELDYDRENNVTGLTNKLGFVVQGKLIRTLNSNGFNGPPPKPITYQSSLANPDLFDKNVKFTDFTGYQISDWVYSYAGGFSWNIGEGLKVFKNGTTQIIDAGFDSNGNPVSINDIMNGTAQPLGNGTGADAEFVFLESGEHHISNCNHSSSTLQYDYFTPSQGVDTQGNIINDDGFRFINGLHIKAWGNNYSNSQITNVGGQPGVGVWIVHSWTDYAGNSDYVALPLNTWQITPTGGIYANYSEEDYANRLLSILQGDPYSVGMHPLTYTPISGRTVANDPANWGVRRAREYNFPDANGNNPLWQYQMHQQWFTAHIPYTVLRTYFGYYSTNPAECLADYLTNKVYGCGLSISDDDLDLDTFYDHKVFCDTLVTHDDPDGNQVTSKRYQCNGHINTNDTKDVNISDIVTNSQAIFSYTLGKFQMISDTTGSSSYTFDDTNIYGSITLVNDGFNSTLNEMNLKFKSKNNKYQDDQVFLEYSDKFYNEPILSKDLSLRFVNTNVEAQRLGTVIMNKSRSNKIISFKTDTRAANLQVNDVVTVKGTYYNLNQHNIFSHEYYNTQSSLNSTAPIGEYEIYAQGENRVYQYSDGSGEARFFVPYTIVKFEDLLDFFKDCINGQFYDTSGQLSVEQAKQNNKLGEIFSFVTFDSSYSNPSNTYGGKFVFHANKSVFDKTINNYLRVDSVTNIYNTSLYSKVTIKSQNDNGTLFKINSISETELNGGVQGYYITAQEYAPDDYTVGTLTAAAPAPSISPTNGYQNINTATNLILNGAFPNDTTPYVDISLDIPNQNNVEGVEIYYGSGSNTLEQNRILVKVFDAPTGNYAAGSTQNFKVQNIPTTTDLYIWVRLINSFSRSAFSVGLSIGDWNPTTNVSSIGNNAIAPVLLGFDYNQYRNLIINGDFIISQRGTTASSSSSGYLVSDMWYSNINNAGTWNHDKVTDVPSDTGFNNSFKLENTSAVTLSSNSYFKFKQFIQGQNLQRLKYGTNDAENLVLTFWVKSSKTGTYIVELYNYDGTRQISKSYTIDTANTWEQKIIYINGDSNVSGLLDNDNDKSLSLDFWLCAGSDYTSGTLNTDWNSVTDVDRADGQVNLGDNANNNWYITGVQLESGNNPSKFEILPYDKSLQRCQHYYYELESILGEAFTGHSSDHIRHINIWFPVTMRDAPTINVTWSTGTNPTNLSNTQYAHCEVDIGAANTLASLTSFSASAELT